MELPPFTCKSPKYASHGRRSSLDRTLKHTTTLIIFLSAYRPPQNGRPKPAATNAHAGTRSATDRPGGSATRNVTFDGDDCACGERVARAEAAGEGAEEEGGGEGGGEEGGEGEEEGGRGGEEGGGRGGVDGVVG